VKTMLLNPPPFDGLDGGAGSRYQARREVRSFWYPTWLAHPAAPVPGTRLIDAPPRTIQVLLDARGQKPEKLHPLPPPPLEETA